jgi:hypothetical protein
MIVALYLLHGNAWACLIPPAGVQVAILNAG